MSLYRENPGHATRWMFANGVLPDAASTDERGHHCVSRVHYGSYVDDTLSQVVAATAGRVVLRHYRSHATAIEMNVATGSDHLPYLNNRRPWQPACYSMP